ncbi:MAG: putative phosphosugar isomerase [Clostridiales bacterium]|jgi:tagatose-6-phosphate ketose/aldose isomerase|nr:putative phosphosugar isomerase [Clostridiales bacterium]
MDTMFGFSSEDMKKRNMEYTVKEISSQKEVWKRLYNKIKLRKNEIQIFLDRFDRDTRIVFTGAGSSGFIGDSLAPIIRKELNFTDVESVHTTDIVGTPEQYLRCDKRTVLVSFGRSGNSPESIAAVDIANSLVDDIYHIIISCNPNGGLSKIINDRTLNLVFEELSNDSFAMTSSVTGMMLAAYSVFTIEKDLTNEIECISFYAKDIIENKYKVIAEGFDTNVNRLVVLGAGNLFGAARESALKSIELTAGKVMTWYDTPIGFRHGPKAMLSENTLILFYVSNNDYTRKYDIDMLKELSSSSRHKLIAVSDKYYENVKECCDLYLYNSTDIELGEAFTPYTAILTAQILALFASVKLDCTPDNPFPNGEVNRVVQGVIIHKL